MSKLALAGRTGTRTATRTTKAPTPRQIARAQRAEAARLAGAHDAAQRVEDRVAQHFCSGTTFRVAAPAVAYLTTAFGPVRVQRIDHHRVSVETLTWSEAADPGIQGDKLRIAECEVFISPAITLGVAARPAAGGGEAPADRVAIAETEHYEADWQRTFARWYGAAPVGDPETRHRQLCDARMDALLAAIAEAVTAWIDAQTPDDAAQAARFAHQGRVKAGCEPVRKARAQLREAERRLATAQRRLLATAERQERRLAAVFAAAPVIDPALRAGKLVPEPEQPPTAARHAQAVA